MINDEMERIRLLGVLEGMMEQEVKDEEKLDQLKKDIKDLNRTLGFHEMRDIEKIA